MVRVAAGGGLGSSHSVAITDQGHVYTFGTGKFGQLGHGKILRIFLE